MTKVLVVEDDRFLSSAYRAKLTKSGFEVEIAGNGEEALEALKTFKPDIILLDMVMPVMDGFTTIGHIRKDSALKSIPIIVTSNLGQKEDLDKAMNLGADDYLVKSNLSLDVLVDKINSMTKAKS